MNRTLGVLACVASLAIGMGAGSMGSHHTIDVQARALRQARQQLAAVGKSIDQARLDGVIDGALAGADACEKVMAERQP